MAIENFYGSTEAYRSFVSDDPGFASLVAPSRGYLALKRLVDLVSALAGLVLLLPLLPFIVLLIKLETPGPILFRQQRVGQAGRLFPCLKFRSMVVDAEDRKADLEASNEATGAAFKIKNDPRITGVGSFLRRSSLDEFPQLLNVLRGEMTIVGPRPQIPAEVARYTPGQALRLEAKPGLTCLWQVSGRNYTSFRQRATYDIYYVRNWSIWLDMYILLRTVWVVLSREGAY